MATINKKGDLIAISFKELEEELNNVDMNYSNRKAAENRLPEFITLGSSGNEHWTVYQVVKRNGTLPESCPKCGCYQPTYKKHNVRVRRVRDLNGSANTLVELMLFERVYRCSECGGMVFEEYQTVAPKSRMTHRLKEYIYNWAVYDSFSYISKKLVISQTEVKNTFMEGVSRLPSLSEIQTPSVLGIDEVFVMTEGEYRKQPWILLASLEQKTVIEMARNRNKNTIIELFRSLRTPQKVGVVTMDMYSAYRAAVYEVFPRALPVIDKFHTISLVQKKLDLVRRAETWMEENQNSIKFSLLKRRENLDAKKRFSLDLVCQKHPRLKAAYEAKERFLGLYECQSRKEAERYFDAWCDHIPKDLPEMLTAAKSMKRCRQEILNFFDTGYTNAYVEGMNNVVRRISKIGEGYSFEVMRGKVMAHERKTAIPKLDYSTLTTFFLGTAQQDTALNDTVIDCGYKSTIDYGVPFEVLLKDWR